MVVRRRSRVSARYVARVAPRLGLLVLLALAVFSIWRPGRHAPAPDHLPEGHYRVQRAVDGDTLLLANGARIRLQGVDTPETKHPTKPVEPFGPEAAAFTARRVEGKPVRLEFGTHRVDRYGRFLAFVYVDGVLLNEELVRRGLARACPQYRYAADMKRRFLAAQEQAQHRRLGIWSTSGADVSHEQEKLDQAQ